MQISSDEGALLTLLVRISGAREVIEIGTFTGYSSICLARGLPADGHLLACDVSGEWTDVARRYWARAGVTDRIELRLGPAAETLAALPETEQFDLAFVDADKGGYLAYYEALVPRLRAGGMLVVDNTLWRGRVADPAADDADTNAIRAVNDRARQDERVETVLLTVADGIPLCRRLADAGA